MNNTKQSHDKYITQLNMNGLSGRMLRLPSPKGKDRHILFIYGQHSSIERWYGVAESLNRYGEVVMPDLPGFGGMDSLYKIGEAATINNLADYLASFIKLKYRNKKVVIVAMSLGFPIVTRMLQRCPELAEKVDSLVSIVGLAHHDDFAISPRRLKIYKLASIFFSRRLPSFIFKTLLLRPFVLRRAYHRTHNAKEKFSAAKDKQDFENIMDMEIKLWSANDIRTQFKTYLEMFNLDNCVRRVNLPVYHVSVGRDRYFNNVRVENHLRQIFTEVEMYKSRAPNHAPTIVADAREAEAFIPDALRRKVFYKRRNS